MSNELISIINLLGIAAIIASFIGLWVEKKKKRFAARQEHKEVRYKAIILLAFYLLNYEKEHLKFKIHRPNINSKQELVDEIFAEWVNMVLYASDKTIFAMKDFITDTSEITFRKLSLQMRKELYGISTKLKIEDLIPNSFSR